MVRQRGDRGRCRIRDRDWSRQVDDRIASRDGAVGARGWAARDPVDISGQCTGPIFGSVRAEMAYYLSVLDVDAVITDNPDQFPVDVAV